MSSGYKIKGHQRSRSAKPYERKTVSNRINFKCVCVCPVNRLYYFSPKCFTIIIFKFCIGFGKPCKGVADPLVMVEQLE